MDKPQIEALYMTTEEVARYLEVSRGRIPHLASAGQITKLKGSMYEAASVEAYKARRGDRKGGRYKKDSYDPDDQGQSLIVTTATCSLRSKADFRALRETVGMSQQFLAEKTGVKVLTVKRWENPAYFPPPKDAWEVLDQCRELQDEAVEKAVSEIGDDNPDAVVQLYYRTQEQYDRYGHGAGDYGIANAESRAAAEALRQRGRSVRYEYPET